MQELSTSTAIPTNAIKTEALTSMSASFERFCLAAGLEALAEMMEQGALAACGERHERGCRRKAHGWGKTKGKIGFHGGKVEMARPWLRGHHQGKPTLGRPLAPALGAQRRRGKCAPRRPRGGRGAPTQRVPPPPGPGADPGHAGRRLIAWRELVARSAGQWRSSNGVAAEVLGIPNDEALQEAVEAAEACASGGWSAPFAAARVFGLARRALAPASGRSASQRVGRSDRRMVG